MVELISNYCSHSQLRLVGRGLPTLLAPFLSHMLRNQVCGELLNCVGKMMAGPTKAPVAGTAAKDAGVVPARRRRRSRQDRRGSKRDRHESRSQGKTAGRSQKEDGQGHSRNRDCGRDQSQGRSSRNSRRSSRRTGSASEYSISHSEEEEGADERPTYVGKFWSGSQLHKSCISYSDLSESVLQEALFILDPKRFIIHE